jgi:hypothetical protein
MDFEEADDVDFEPEYNEPDNDYDYESCLESCVPGIYICLHSSDVGVDYDMPRYQLEPITPIRHLFANFWKGEGKHISGGDTASPARYLFLDILNNVPVKVMVYAPTTAGILLAATMKARYDQTFAYHYRSLGDTKQEISGYYSAVDSYLSQHYDAPDKYKEMVRLMELGKLEENKVEEFLLNDYLMLEIKRLVDWVFTNADSINCTQYEGIPYCFVDVETGETLLTPYEPVAPWHGVRKRKARVGNRVPRRTSTFREQYFSTQDERLPKEKANV